MSDLERWQQIAAERLQQLRNTEAERDQALAERDTLQSELRAANEWAKVMEHERDYEREVVSVDLAERLQEAQQALAEVHEYQCGCDDPGNSALCVAKPEGTFQALASVSLPQHTTDSRSKRSRTIEPSDVRVPQAISSWEGWPDDVRDRVRGWNRAFLLSFMRSGDFACGGCGRSIEGHANGNAMLRPHRRAHGVLRCEECVIGLARQYGMPPADLAEGESASCSGPAVLDTTPGDELLNWAWTIICNAGEGDWTRESPEWQEAAAGFREKYHASLARSAGVETHTGTGEEAE